LLKSSTKLQQNPQTAIYITELNVKNMCFLHFSYNLLRLFE